jgi:hypothetical protein
MLTLSCLYAACPQFQASPFLPPQWLAGQFLLPWRPFAWCCVCCSLQMVLLLIACIYCSLKVLRCLLLMLMQLLASMRLLLCSELSLTDVHQ